MIVAVRRGRVYPCAECHAAGRPTGRWSARRASSPH